MMYIGRWAEYTQMTEYTQHQGFVLDHKADRILRLIKQDKTVI